MAMKYAPVGRSGLMVSQICLGTFMYGGQVDPGEARWMVGRAKDAGVNFIDTADNYGRGVSEEIVGAAIEGERDRWVLATKVGHIFGDGVNESGLTRRWIMRQVDASLRRLRTDYVDALYLHKEDAATPTEETLLAVADVIRLGKVRYFGVSNHSGWRLAEISVLCRQIGMDPPLFNQPHYNINDRTAELECIPACARFGVGVVPYSPLARGVLTGKYPPGQAPDPNTRAGLGDRRLMQVEWREEALLVAQKVKQRAEARGMTATHFALLWVLGNAQVCSAVCGARTRGQLEGYLGALDYSLTDEDEAFVDSLVAPGQTAPAGFIDPQFPVTGRLRPH